MFMIPMPPTSREIEAMPASSAVSRSLTELAVLAVYSIAVFAAGGLFFRHLKRGFADVRSRCEREPHLLKQGASFVLYALMDNVVDRYFPVMGALTAETAVTAVADVVATGALGATSFAACAALPASFGRFVPAEVVTALAPSFNRVISIGANTDAIKKTVG